jgi:hypothetical protein
VVALLGAAATAQAQTAPPWTLSGSDTLENVMRESITAAETTPNGTGGTILTPGLLKYGGGGSGTAETANTSNTQVIAPMSRNYKLTVMNNDVQKAWAPQVQNVIAADAAVIVTKQSTGRAKNLAIANTFDAVSNTNKADPNVSSAYVQGTTGSGYTAIIQVILSGIDGSGSFAACADPRRAQAIVDFAQANGVATVDTFYRRDDNSGTTSVFQDKMNVGRFCNGRAFGVLGSNTFDSTNPNLNNQDLDPVRRPCFNPGLLNGVQRQNVRCTWTAASVTGGKQRGDFCTYLDNATFTGCEGTNSCPCTRGLVVALSRGETLPPDLLSDVTLTIASRVGADSAKRSFGYAGRESVRQAQPPLSIPTNAPFVNNTSYGDGVVQSDAYLLSRRLYVNFASTNTDATTGQAAEVAAETALYNFMTDPAGTVNPDGSRGRCNIESIIRKWGFIPCTNNCSTNPSGNNICAKKVTLTLGVNNPTSVSTFPGAPSTTAACFPNATGGANTSVDFTASLSGASGICCSTNAAPVGGACPASIPTGGLATASLLACANDSDCASGVCADNLGTGVRQCQ